MNDVALIPLFWRGHHVTDALVDQADWHELAKHHWNTSPVHLRTRELGYAYRGEGGNFIRMERQILGLDFGDPRVIHHRNQVKFDNRRSNLQVFADRREHMICGEHVASMLERIRLGQGLVQEARAKAGLPAHRFMRHREIEAERRTRLLGRRVQIAKARRESQVRA